MANLNTKLQITTGKGQTYGMEMSDTYTEVYQTINKVDNSDGFITLASLSKVNSSLLKGSKLIVIKNNSPVGVELQFHINKFTEAGSGVPPRDVYSADARVTQLLGANEYMILPNQYMIEYNGDNSAANAKTIDNKGGFDVNSGKMYVDSVANLGAKVEDSETQVTVDDTDYFRVGDLIQLGTTTGTTATKIEILRVVSIDSATVMQVERALYGSLLGDGDAQTTGHVSGAAVHLPFINTQGKYDENYDDADALGKVQTNSSGRYTSTNLFGYGRLADYPSGIVKGSFAMKFYSQAYQELGLSGVTSASNSGLTASTAYQFQVAVDGGSAYDVDVTTDASDLSVGKVLSLIQAQFDSAYYASTGNLKNKRLTVGIVNGDIRFTSGSKTRVSAVALSDSLGGDTDIWGVGIFPAVASVEAAVASRLPDDTLLSNDTFISSSNMGVFSYDNGKGNISGGEASGTINYETGALDITGPPNAEFVASFNYESAHSGGVKDTSNQENGLVTISGRSMNSKINAEIEILGFV